MTKKPKRIKVHVSKLRVLNACSEAVDFATKFSSLQAAWDKCERGDWMLWLLGKLIGPVGSNSRKRLLVVTCECARLALPYTKNPDVLKCIETIEAYVRNEVSLDDVQNASKTIYAVPAPAADAYAAAAAITAAYAAYAAATAAYASDAYAAAAYAADAATYAAADAAKQRILERCADIVRKHYPEAPNLKEPK